MKNHGGTVFGMQFFRLSKKNVPYYIIVSWLLIGMHVFIPNNGGIGFNLPQNYLSAILAFLLSCFAWSECSFNYVVVGRVKFLAIGIIIISIPVFYTNPLWLHTGVWHIFGLFFGMWIYLSCLQVKNVKLFSVRIVIILIFSALLQVALSSLSLTEKGGIYGSNALLTGVFQQRNVLASFLSTGFSCVCFIYYLRSNCMQEDMQSIRVIPNKIILTSLFVLSAGVAITQSRTGLLGIIATILLFSVSFRKQCKQSGLILILSILGYFAGMMFIYYFSSSLPDLNHTGSNASRVVLLKNLYHYFQGISVYGYGYGSFEYTFQHVIVKNYPVLYTMEVFRHPHNEEIYWLAEGGIFALIGLLVLFITILRTILKAWHFREKNPIPLMLVICTVPILIHTQLEYPFYISLLHYLLVIMFLAFSDKMMLMPEESSGLVVKPSMVTLITGSILLICFFLINGLSGSVKLTEFERDMMESRGDQVVNLNSVEKLMNHERYEYDMMTASLLVFNQTKDINLLYHYKSYAINYLKSRVDKNIYINVIAIANYTGDTELAKKYKNEYLILFAPRKTR